MKLLVSTVAPYFWVKLNKHGKPIENGQFRDAAFINTIPKSVTSVIGVAPADSITFHSVDIPTKRQANMLSAVPYALEESLSEEIENLHFTVMSWTPGAPAQVAVIAKDRLSQWIHIFQEAGIELDSIVPELALLPIHPDCTATIIMREDDQFVVKSAEYESILCDQEAFEYWWSEAQNQQAETAVNSQELAVELKSMGGVNVSHWAIGEDFRSWLEHVPDQLNSAPSLLHGEFEPEHLKPNSSWLNMAAGLAVGALLLLGVSHWIEANSLQDRYTANQQQIRALFDEAFPDQEYLDQPRRQIASLLSISEGNPASEMFQYLLDVSAQIVPANNAKFEEINYRNQQLQIGVSAPTFAALEQMTSQINARDDIQATLISSGARGKRVTGQIKMARAL